MTIAEQLRTAGRKEGMQQGRQEGKMTIAKNMLAEGLAIEFIKKITGLSDEDLANL